MSYPPLPLPGLTSNDPENHLSYESRQRIARALIEADRIQSQAFASLETRYRAVRPSGDIGFGEWLSSGSAFVDLIESRMEAACTVLRVEAEEYGGLRLPNTQFREIMRGRIEGTVHSLELTTVQARALELEFVWTTSPQVGNESRSVERREDNLMSAAERVEAFMREKGLTQVAFAEKFRVSERILRSVLAANAVGKATQAAVAKALGTTADELFRK